MELKGTSQHLTSPLPSFVSYTQGEEEMIQRYLKFPDGDMTNETSHATNVEPYYKEVEHPHYQHSHPLQISIDMDPTPQIAIDDSLLCAPAPVHGNGAYRSYPPSPSIASSRGSSPYPPSPGNLSPIRIGSYSPYSSASSGIMTLSPANLSSPSFENLSDSLSYYPNDGRSGSPSTSQLFSGLGMRGSVSPALSSSLSLPITTSSGLDTQLGFKTALVDEAFSIMAQICQEVKLQQQSMKSSVVPMSRNLREDLRNRAIGELHRRLPGYSNFIDHAASKIIGTAANREAANKRKKNKGSKHFCFFCKEHPSFRGFTTKDNFLTHLRTHFDVKLSACKGCGHRFPNKTVPSRHRVACSQKFNANASSPTEQDIDYD
ncbi:hypothetical protein CVT24_010326 [Panaeolus cyanescens]|uniref:C2H2-type domain-containing protein n=1 Tax=Panaeolus cyanescens TaxID=181874 RepID=A0A409VAL6_9AGAR|nr:hypothetical protein CVT24_010326 [Panaeolus cyanescens]